MTDEQILLLARTFADELRAELGNSWTKFLARAAQDRAQCCSSHDFCDANMTMARAFERVTGREPDTASESDVALWNAAWSRARRERWFAGA